MVELELSVEEVAIEPRSGSKVNVVVKGIRLSDILEQLDKADVLEFYGVEE